MRARWGATTPDRRAQSEPWTPLPATKRSAYRLPYSRLWRSNAEPHIKGRDPEDEFDSLGSAAPELVQRTRSVCPRLGP
jgi:hypothetical protein